jgi:hypothetical protein
MCAFSPNLERAKVVPEPKKDDWQSCEIVSMLGALPFYAANMLFFNNFVGFQAESRSARGTTVLAQAKGTENLPQAELESGIKETPKRRAMVAEVTNKLLADHWQQDGRGAEWFNLKFRRKAA